MTKWSKRALNVFYWEKMENPTLEELATWSARELLRLRGCGVTTLTEIRDRLAEAGLSLRGDGEPRKKLKPPVFDRGAWPSNAGPEPTKAQACWSCAFWEHLTMRDDETGHCHRFPPSAPQEAHEDDDGAWTPPNSCIETIGTDWCGEWGERRHE